MTVNKLSYTPGMCNIGPAERRVRRLSGLAAAIATVGLMIIFTLTDAPWGLRIVVFVPAAVAASGFLQDALHFCVAFGMRGIYNVINSAGVTNNVELEAYRKKDRVKALQILTLSTVIGLAVMSLTLVLG